MRKTNPFLALVALLVGLFAVEAFAQTSSRALIGNWRGEDEFGPVEIAAWFSPNSVEIGYIRGFVFNHEANCRYGLVGHRVMSPATRLFGPVLEHTLTDYALEMELRYVDHATVRNDRKCTPLGEHVRILLAYDPAEETASLSGYGDPRMNGSYGNLTEISRLQRATPSPTMQAILRANPAIDGDLGRLEPPPAGVMAMIANPALDPEQTISASAIPCRAQVRDQQVQMRSLGIPKVSASFESENVVGVTFTRYGGPLPNWEWPEDLVATKEEKYFQADADSVAAAQFLAYPFASDPFRLGPDACNQARALEGFIALQRNAPASSESRVAAAPAPMPRIETADDMYFVDRFGIDVVERNRMRRVFGTTTIFHPGDLSREGTWAPATQVMRLRAMVKHNETGFIEADLLSQHHEAHFVYSNDSSKKYGGDVWTSIADSRTGGICTRWRDKHFVDNCSERSSAAMHEANRHYMTRDLELAKRLFTDISPDAVTRSAQELNDPARTCANGTFCELPGGTYLNAIYRGDFDQTWALDQIFRRNAMQRIEDSPYSTGAHGALLKAGFEVMTPKSLLPQLAKRYMFFYQRKPANCLRPGWKVHVEKEYIRPEITPGIDYDDIPMPDTVITEGHTITSKYSINPNFFALCDQFCDWVTPEHSDGFETPAHESVSTGIDRVLFDNDCQSAEIQQFEKNLIKLTFRTLDATPSGPFVERSSL